MLTKKQGNGILKLTVIMYYAFPHFNIDKQLQKIAHAYICFSAHALYTVNIEIN